MSVLEANGLIKRYRATVALAGVDLTVGSAELVGLLGPNGAGKSTFVKIACGLIRPTAGSVDICGRPAGSPDARAGIGYLAELFRFPPWLRAHEVLALHQQLAGSGGEEEERLGLLERVGLSHAMDRRVDAMSKGMQQRLGLAQALIGSPKLLLLDEPTSALDPGGRRMVRDLLADLKGQGMSVLLNSHLLTEVELVCDRVVILLSGEVIAEGVPGEMAGSKGVEIETASGLQSFPNADRHQIPELVKELVDRGELIYSVRSTSPSLEDVYLDAVRGEIG